MLAFLAIFSVFFVLYLVFINNYRAMDQKTFSAISPWITEKRTRLMLAISFFGSHYFLIPVNTLLVIFLIARNKKWMAIRAAVVSLSSVLVMTLLKTCFHRHRPPGSLVEGITNYSFPSGHSFMSVAFYGLLIWLAVIYSKNNLFRYSIFVFLSLFILVIGFSRIYLRVHYATDVIAGFSLGLAWLIFCLWFVGIWEYISYQRLNPVTAKE
jgi:membrane-associated phospholipid phosphatase